MCRNGNDGTPRARTERLDTCDVDGTFSAYTLAVSSFPPTRRAILWASLIKYYSMLMG